MARLSRWVRLWHPASRSLVGELWWQRCLLQPVWDVKVPLDAALHVRQSRSPRKILEMSGQPGFCALGLNMIAECWRKSSHLSAQRARNHRPVKTPTL